MMTITCNDIVILNIHCGDYRWVLSGISKTEAINLIMHNFDLTEFWFCLIEKYQYFIGYLYENYRVKPWDIMLLKTNWIYFLIKDDDLLKKYYTIWNKISANAKV